MPAGVSWGEYLRFAVAALASMALGSQAVHHLYRPLDDMDKIVENMNNTPAYSIGNLRPKGIIM